jgi:hypothetical protein
LSRLSAVHAASMCMFTVHNTLCWRLLVCVERGVMTVTCSSVSLCAGVQHSCHVYADNRHRPNTSCIDVAVTTSEIERVHSGLLTAVMMLTSFPYLYKRVLGACVLYTFETTVIRSLSVIHPPCLHADSDRSAWLLSVHDDFDFGFCFTNLARNFQG